MMEKKHNDAKLLLLCVCVRVCICTCVCVWKTAFSISTIVTFDAQ